MCKLRLRLLSSGNSAIGLGLGLGFIASGGVVVHDHGLKLRWCWEMQAQEAMMLDEIFCRCVFAGTYGAGDAYEHLA
jgi:hypothetical protein